MSRNFEAKDADAARGERALPLLLGLTGASNSGKTYSAFELATGIQSVVGGDIYAVDSEQRRALHYADRFKFKHVEFNAPYGSNDYLEALRYCKKQGAGVAIIDSCSLEHEGPGGLLEQHEEELTRMAGNDYAKRERMTMLAWQKPKAARRKLITAITTELTLPVIFCFRSKQSTKPMKVDGKLKPVEMGYSMIGGDEWIYELGFNALLMPGSGGVPTWQSELPGEKATIKMPSQFKWLMDERGPFTRDMGRKLAEWSKFGSKGRPSADTPATTSKPKQTAQEWLDKHLFNIDAASTQDELTAVLTKAIKPLAKLQAGEPVLHNKAIKKAEERAAELRQPAHADDPFQ